MRPSISLFKVLVLLLAGSAASASDGVGVRQLSVVAPERGTPLSVTVWYPAEAGGEPVAVGENKIFEGTRALKGATIRKQRFPLVLLSHGSGSRVEGMAWIATKLAETGFVVAGPNHPGTTSGDSTPAATPKIWERTGDLSAITTALTADPYLASSIDPHRIGVLGFSLGGSTAMELAGARADLDAFVRYCDTYPAMMDCRWFRGERGLWTESRSRSTFSTCAASTELISNSRTVILVSRRPCSSTPDSLQRSPLTASMPSTFR